MSKLLALSAIALFIVACDPPKTEDPKPEPTVEPSADTSAKPDASAKKDEKKDEKKDKKEKDDKGEGGKKAD